MIRHRRGFTLIELVVTIALAFLVLSLFYTFLDHSREAAELTGSRVRLQQTGLVAMERLLSSLQATDRDGVFTLEDGAPSPAVAVVPISQVSSEGRRVWERRLHLFYWDQDSRELRLAVWGPDEAAARGVALSADAPPSLDRAGLEALVQASQGSLLAQDVADFSMIRAPEAQIDLQLEAGRRKSGEPERYQLRRTVYLREAP